MALEDLPMDRIVKYAGYREQADSPKDSPEQDARFKREATHSIR